MSRNIWFTSDQHFYHANIIRYSKRPFSSVEEMNERLVELHNVLVREGDVVYHLGDLGFCKASKLKPVLDRLNGRKFLTRGNHDLPLPELWNLSSFENIWTCRLGRLPSSKYILGTPAMLCHYPYKENATSHDKKYLTVMPPDEGRWLIHGHIHERRRESGRMINVGVDVWGYRPVHLDEVRALIRVKELEEPEDTDCNP